MRHPEPEALALHALGEPALTAADAQHIDLCPECRDDMTSFRRTVDVVRGDEWAEVGMSGGTGPSPGVWSRISDELGLAPAQAPVGRPAADLPSRVATPLAPSPFSPAPAPTPLGPRRAARTRRRSRSYLPSLVAACLAGVVVGGGVTAAWLSRTAGPQSPEAELAAPLRRLDGIPSGSGEAVLAVADGRRVLQVRAEALPGTSGFHEVWLIDAATGSMVALGNLTDAVTDPAPEGFESFVVPEGLDLATYDLVDVSDEPLDGNPAHSGRSLLRGTLAA